MGIKWGVSHGSYYFAEGWEELIAMAFPIAFYSIASTNPANQQQLKCDRM
jgi:hypothetical protein